MARAKKKLLPKDFEQLLAGGGLETLQKVFETCELDARGGLGKHTALAFDDCPDDLARWLVARGADLEARNAWGRTALHERARSRRGRIRVLIELGADLEATSSAGTPLHCAVDGKNLPHVELLLEHGAKVDATNEEGLTPLEHGLVRCSNIDIEPMAPIARLLLKHGARTTPRMKTAMAEIGRRFEFHRGSFNRDHLAATDQALAELYELFEVPPAPRRVVHDGAAPITVKSRTWQEQHEELWDLLVPSGGAAATVQGEVIRISGRVAHEILDNGGCNWDDDFRQMTKALLEHLASGQPLAEPSLDQARGIVRAIRQRADDTPELQRLAVSWVLANPVPVKLPAPAYKR
jgi:hypothetical protein